MRKIDLAKLREQYRGTELRELVQHHLRRQSQSARIRGLKGTIETFPPEASETLMRFIDEWNVRVHDETFWQRDTSEVFDEFLPRAREALRPYGLDEVDKAAFDLFNLVILQYAYDAYSQPVMRRFMKIKGEHFPWPSAAALLYPAYGVFDIAMRTPADLWMVAGYGITALGYTLVAAGVLSGTFRILGLRSRWQVLAGGVCAFVTGVVLSNIS